MIARFAARVSNRGSRSPPRGAQSSQSEAARISIVACQKTGIDRLNRLATRTAWSSRRVLAPRRQDARAASPTARATSMAPSVSSTRDLRGGSGSSGAPACPSASSSPGRRGARRPATARTGRGSGCVQAEEGPQRPHRLLAVGALGADHLVDDRAGDQTDHQEDGDADAEERGHEWTACGRGRSGAWLRARGLPEAPARPAKPGRRQARVAPGYRSSQTVRKP